jgi:tRNA nucleotidyltransferase/poly(A) polymerase
MDELVRAAVAGEDAYVVGGAVRDEFLGRPIVDLDIACREPERAARRYREGAGGALFPLSERHGAWRVALPDRTVDFTPLRDGIDADLATRDFTINAIAVSVAGGEAVDPFGGRADLDRRALRAVTDAIFEDDPLRLLRAVRLEDELGFRMEPGTEALVRRHAGLVTRPAGERILAELRRLSPAGFQRLDELGLLAPLGGTLERLEHAEVAPHRDFLLALVFGDNVRRLPVSNETARFTRALLAARTPRDDSPREIHRFRRATEPWALEALAFLGAADLYDAVRAAREKDPAEPLLRGDELGLPPGPVVGRLLEKVEEERAAGTISTREEALELVRREVDRLTDAT